MVRGYKALILILKEKSMPFSQRIPRAYTAHDAVAQAWDFDGGMLRYRSSLGKPQLLDCCLRLLFLRCRHCKNNPEPFMFNPAATCKVIHLNNGLGLMASEYACAQHVPESFSDPKP